MKWIYWATVFETKFQANCVKTRMEQDWWIREYDSPDLVEVFEMKSGKFGVRYIWDA